MRDNGLGAALDTCHRHVQLANRSPDISVNEVFYCGALSVEFALRDIPFEAQYPVQVEYKGQLLRGIHHLDFLCFGSVIVEAKAVSTLTSADEAQLLNYLAMTRMKRGLLINFGAKSLEYKRRVM